MRDYNVYFVDADGTLFDFEKAESEALSGLFLSHNYLYDDTVLMTYREINHDLWRRFDSGQIAKDDLLPMRFLLLSQRLNLIYDAAEMNREYPYRLGQGAYLLEGALEFCQQVFASGKKLYIVTNGVSSTQRMRFSKSPILPFISKIFISEEIGTQKPHIAFFDAVFSAIPETDKGRMLIVGDSLTADIAGGQNAGIDSCWYNPGNLTNTGLIRPTMEIRHLGELL